MSDLRITNHFIARYAERILGKQVPDTIGMSYRKISAFLNRSGIKTIRGFKWTETGSSAHSVLKKKDIRDNNIKIVRNKAFDYEITDMDIKIL